MARSKKKPVSRSRVAALLVIVVLVAAAGAGIVRIYGSRLPELRSKSQALEAQIQQTEKQNDALRSDLEHQGDQDFIQGLARDDLGLASDGERIFYVLDLGKGGSAVLPRNEQVPGETFTEGQTVQVYVVDVLATDRGPRVTISRTHPGLVKRMFELEVPEIYDGTVEVKAIAREAGARTKLAVWSKNPDVDPVGACIGARGVRVEKIVQELNGEKIDVIRWSEDITEFISAALSPAKVVKVELLPGETKSCRVTVPDHQLSLAIGNKGQNVRLCAHLTGYNIDIRPESGYYGEDEE